MGVLNEAVAIAEALCKEETRIRIEEQKKKVNQIQKIMAMRCVINNYTFPAKITIIIQELKEKYESILQNEYLYKDSLKREQYTDAILQNRNLAEELDEQFLEISQKLYEELLKLEEVPLCIRETFTLLRIEETNLEYLEKEYNGC